MGNQILRLAAIFALVFSVLVSITFAQLSQRDDAQADNSKDGGKLVFKSQSHYVMVPVVVTNDDGQPARGLSRGDFTVLENGHKQSVVSFEEVLARDLPVERDVATPTVGVPGAHEISNRIANAGRRPIIIIAVDLINTPRLDQDFARDQLLTFLGKGIPENSLVQLITFGRDGVHVVRDFTADSATLARAALALAAQPHQTRSIEQNRKDLVTYSNVLQDALDMNKALEQLAVVEAALAQQDLLQRQDAVASTTAAFEAVSHAYAGVPGRKSLVWLTASFPVSTLELPDRERYAHSLEALASANVAVYPVDVRGIVGIGFAGAPLELTMKERGMVPRGQAKILRDDNATPTYVRDLEAKHSETIDTMRQAAEMTGGRAFYNSNDIGNSIRSAASEGTSYYMLTYKLRTGDTRPGWRKLDVRVARQHVTVRARRGVYLDQAVIDPALSRKPELIEALQSPLDYTALPLTVRWREQANDSRERIIRFEVVLPAGAIKLDAARTELNYDFAFLATNEEGIETASRIQTYTAKINPEKIASLAETGLTYKDEFTLAPAPYSVRFVVRDNVTGNMGSVGISSK